MIWNSIKQFLWCGVVHLPRLTMDLGYPDLRPTEKDKGKIAYCIYCGTYWELK